jgi:hypothetical protein
MTREKLPEMCLKSCLAAVLMYDGLCLQVRMEIQNA